jgi:tetratricopeptide (TPR) repeat protein
MKTKEKGLHMLKQRIRRVGLSAAVVPVLLTLLFVSGCSRDPNVRKQKYLASGIRYEKAGKLKEAAIQFQNALKQDHNFADAHYELAKVYLQTGYIKPGYGELMRTVELAPGNLTARVDLGNLLMAGNALDRASDQVKAVLAADPNNAAAYALRANIDARKGDRDQALTDIQHAISIKPNEASFHTTLALIEASDPKTMDTAQGELQKAVSLDPKDTHARMLLAALLEKKGDKTGAEQQYLATIEESPKDFQPRASLAGLYVRVGNSAKAEQTLRKMVEDLNDNDQASELLKDYYIHANQVDAGVNTFADLTSKYPKSVPIKVTYATMLVLKRDNAKAEPVIDELYKKNPNQPQVEVLKSAMLLNASKVDEAYTLLQNAAKNSPDNLQLQLALAKVARLKGDAVATQAAYQAAERLAPRDIDIHANLAELASERHDYAALAEIGNKAIELRPDLAQAYLWRGMAEANEKQFDKAEADFQTALTKDPNNPSTYQELGELRLREGKNAEGLTMLEKSLDKNPNMLQALREIVEVDLVAKQPDKAVARVQQQIAKSPKNPAFYGLLASVQLATKDFNGARDNAKKAMDMNPADEAAVRTYTTALSNTGGIDTAIQTWQTWANAHPKDGFAYTMLGGLSEQKGDQAKAIDDYKKALAIDSSVTTTGLSANNLAYLMVTTGQNPDLALQYAQQARRALPNSPNTADTLGWAYYYKGTYFTARDLLEAAAKDAPDDATVHYHLGMTYSKLGRKADAVAQLKKAVALGGSTQTAKDATAALGPLS